MRKNYYLLKLAFSLLFFIPLSLFSQANIKVQVISVSVGNTLDSDGFLSGNSDFAFEYGALDNTLLLGNNNPAAFGLTGDFNFSYKNDDNGPWNLAVNSVFFDHDYICPQDVPTSVEIKWQGYENDAPIVNWDLLGTLSDDRTGVQLQAVPVPGSTGTTGVLTYTATGGGQSYTITFEVIRTDLNIPIMVDNICSALNIPADDAVHAYAYCGNYTIETGEPIFQSIGDAGHGSAWFYFTLPSTSSGNIRIDTDLSQTAFGTEIALYHAADGFGCIQGTNTFSNLQIKNKFNYLSEHSYADDDIPVIAPEGKATGNWNGGLISEGEPLIPGETYYIQVNSDIADQKGSMGFRITDLGGTPTSFNDIPCTSPTLASIVPETTVTSENTNANSPTITMSYANASDREAGAPFAGTDAADYVAYLYTPPVGTSNSIDENVWFNFKAPNSGRVYLEGEIASFVGISEAEDIAIYALDERFAPGQPTDLFCSNLTEIAAASGSVSGSSRTAKINATCLEPGYTYYGMLDPQSVSTTSSGKVWIYDPSVSDPTFNPPGNDILCLAIQDTLFEVPVILAGTNPTFQAVAGTNRYACREYLAGEPAIVADPTLRADQTVWHYFTAPPTGAVEMSIRAYVGLDTLRYNVFELLNGIDCYGGLQPATYTNDGTQATSIITPIISGTAGYTGSQTSACCLVPGKIYAIQIDGGSQGDEGQYIIEYIREVASDAGDVYATLANGDTIKVTQPDTAFVCFGDTITPGILLNGIGQSTADIPSCLTAGYILHQNAFIPTNLSSITFIDSVQTIDGTFANTGNGSGTFGNPSYNQIYYLSPAGDLPATWGDFDCISSTVEPGIPVVFLQPLNAIITYNNNNCTASFSATGGYSSYSNLPYNYTITDPNGNVAFTGNLTPGVVATYLGGIAGVYTLTINDGTCPRTYTFDASNCNNPCVPVTVTVSKSICPGSSIFLGGQLQTTAGTYVDVFITSEGCDSTVTTNLSITPIITSTVQFSICNGASVQVGTSTYNAQGVYVDTLQSLAGCDSVVTSVVFMLPYPIATKQASICEGEEYIFGGQSLTVEGVYQDTVYTAGSCDSVINLVLTVTKCDFIISNVITPNGDGQNDTWKVSDPTYISGCTVKVYNRWGQPVFETKDYNNEWDGTKNGEDLPDGVYFYSIKCDENEFTGSINLLRFKK